MVIVKLFPFCSCFIREIRLLYGIFLAPIFVVLLFNVFMFVIIARVLIKHSKKKLDHIKNEKEKVQKKRAHGILKTLISIMSVMTMFGLSWVFGAFSIGDGAIVFQWLFVIFNTSQGFMLFLFFCVIGADAREEWKNLLTCNKYKTRKSLTAQMLSSMGNTNSNTRFTKRRNRTIGSGSVETALTSDGRNSNTIRRSTGIGLDSDYEPERLPTVEMAPFYKTIVDEEERLSKVEDTDNHVETSLAIVIKNDHTAIDTKNHEPEKPKFQKRRQLPPHMYIKMKRSMYTVETIKYNTKNDEPEKIDYSREIYDDDENDMFSQDAQDLVFSNCTQDSLTDSIARDLEPAIQTSFRDSVILSNESLYSQEQVNTIGLTDDYQNNEHINDSSQCVLLP